MDELKPCPFCGGKAASFSEYTSEKYEGKNIWRAWVGCSDPYCPMGIGFEVSGEGDSWCDGSGYDKYNNPAPKLKAKAEKLWNRRAAPENKPLTNGDHIRSMSNEELANLLDNAEGAGYNDTSIIVNENHYPADKLDWMNQPYSHKPEGSETT